MQRINIFVKKGYYYNLSSGVTGDKINMPMYNRDIKLFKGIENKIQFCVRDHDRKSYPLRDKKLFLNMFLYKRVFKFKDPFCIYFFYKAIVTILAILSGSNKAPPLNSINNSSYLSN